MTYFISGHRDITKEEFNSLYKPLINKAILLPEGYGLQPHFVIGDYEGVDIMTQEYLASILKDKSLVTVYHMFDKPRNLASDEFNLVGGFMSDEARDSAMTNASDVDIAFVRKGKWNSGTAQNIKRRHQFE